MSISWGNQLAKLKTNLRLGANRLKLLQKKKTEQAMKARTEIAEFLLNDKEDRARIRVESIIREDFVVEAYEILEMFCELLLARFGLIQQMKEIDDGIAEAVASLLWVAPRISHEIVEFKIISAQLEQKYGKQYAETARMNQLPEPSRVAPKLVQKLGVSAPSKLLVEKYLIAIAKCAGVEFTPDPRVMRDDDDEIALAEKNLINFMKDEQIGWSVPPAHNAPGAPHQPMPPYVPPPNFGAPPPSYPGGPSGGVPTANFYTPQPNNAPPHGAPQPPVQPPPSQPPAGFARHDDFDPSDCPPPPQLHSHNPEMPPAPPRGSESKAPPIDKSNDQHIYETPADNSQEFVYEFPEPPSDFDTNYSDSKHNKNGGGSNGGGGAGGSGGARDELNFEELTERFKKLTKK